MGTISAKVCTTCGLDVSTQKRVKDAHGRYYCHPCAAALGMDIVKAPEAKTIPLRGATSPVASRSVRSPSVRTAPALGQSTSRRPNPSPTKVASGWEMEVFWVIVKVIGGILGGTVAVVAVAWVAALATRPPPSDSPAPSHPPPPQITVTGVCASSVHFGSWRPEGYTIVATMTWDGSEKFDAITWTAKRNGVVVQSSNLMVPGNHLVKGQPMDVTVLLMEEPAGMDVTIVVGP